MYSSILELLIASSALIGSPSFTSDAVCASISCSRARSSLISSVCSSEAPSFKFSLSAVSAPEVSSSVASPVSSELSRVCSDSSDKPSSLFTTSSSLISSRRSSILSRSTSSGLTVPPSTLSLSRTLVSSALSSGMSVLTAWDKSLFSSEKNPIVSPPFTFSC